MKLGNLEFRNIAGRFPEIVCWQTDGCSKDFCYTIASWCANNEDGYSLEFISDRPFHQQINPRDVWELMKYGQKVLNAEFDMERYKNEERF